MDTSVEIFGALKINTPPPLDSRSIKKTNIIEQNNSAYYIKNMHSALWKEIRGLTATLETTEPSMLADD